MDVEIITHEPNTILDLTREEQPTDEPEGKEATTEDSPMEEGESGDTGSDGDSASDVDGDTGSDADEDSPLEDESDKETDKEEEDGESFFFNGEEVSVEVPDEVANALEEAGVDKSVVLKELFSKEGSFELSKDTREKLEAKYGKIAVDGYLNMYKSLNEKASESFKETQQKEAESLATQGKEFLELAGGEEGLVALEDYMVNSLNDDQILAYNNIMEQGDHASQMLFLQTIKDKKALEDKLNNGDELEMLSDKGASNSSNIDPLSKGYLSSQEFNAIMAEDGYNSRYWTDSSYAAKVDAARAAGQKRGV